MRLNLVIIGFLLLSPSCFCGTFQKGKWSFTYDLAAAGTRSETVIGSLTYDGKKLPKEYNKVITPVGEFIYRDYRGLGSEKRIEWVPYSWSYGSARTGKDVEAMLDQRNPNFRSSLPKKASSSVASTEPCLGGSLERLPEGVGSDWFYVITRGLWVNPQAINQVAETKLSATN